jgi:hypothetical protein
MSKFDDALARLEQAVTLLEAAERGLRRTGPQMEQQQLREIATQIAARIDGALARIDLALGGEG